MVARRTYVPDRAHLIWLEFTPQTGREQSGRRPALVLSPKAYNEVTSLALVCPITSKVKGYPFEVAVPDGLAIRQGVVLADHLKSVDWRARSAAFADSAPAELVDAVWRKLRALLEPARAPAR
jgi:mRNA interferase MazF